MIIILLNFEFDGALSPGPCPSFSLLKKFGQLNFLKVNVLLSFTNCWRRERECRDKLLELLTSCEFTILVSNLISSPPLTLHLHSNLHITWESSRVSILTSSFRMDHDSVTI